VTHLTWSSSGGGSGGYVAAIRSAQLALNTRSSDRSTVAESASTSLHSSNALLAAKPNWPTSSITKGGQGIWHQWRVDHRLRRESRLTAVRKVAEAARRRCALPDEEEQDHRDPRIRHVFTDANTLSVDSITWNETVNVR